MLFNSLEFLLFAPIALAGHALLNGRALRAWMLVVSYIFYGWGEPWYCLLLLASTLLDYEVGKGIAASTSETARKRWLALSLVGNLGMLGFFKYGGLVTRWLDMAAVALIGHSVFPPFPPLTVPPGISFYTFQTLCYSIDIYRGQLQPARSFSSMALYVAYFPQLVAGPIERAGSLLPQLEQKQPRSWDDIRAGLTRVLWGLTKKVVFADWFGYWVEAIWHHPNDATPWELFIALHAFSFQIYLDFSAYSDIAIGLARMMGIRLTENFRWPFLSRNPLEFWTRWHITLTSWVRDYLFIPLGGSRMGTARNLFNGFVVMMVIGLWHGADEKFILWGLLHWGYDTLYRLYAKARGITWREGTPYSWRDVPAVLLTYFLVIPQVFFGARTVSDAFIILGRIFAPWGPLAFTQPPEVVLRTVIFLAIAMTMHVIRGLGLERPYTARVRSPVLLGLFWAGLALLMALLHAPVREQFYYFQF